MRQYNQTTGATINATFINGQGLNAPFGMALDANDHLFVANNSKAGRLIHWAPKMTREQGIATVIGWENRPNTD